MGGGGEPEVDACPVRPCEPNVKAEDGEGSSLPGVAGCPCPLVDGVKASSSCWDMVEGVPKLSCEGVRDCEIECELKELGAGEPRPNSPKSARLDVDPAGLEEPVRRVMSRWVRVGGWGSAVKGIGTGNSGRSSSPLTASRGGRGGVVPSIECLRVLGRRGVENVCSGAVAVVLVGSLTLVLATGRSGGVQFATNESRSGCIFPSNGATAAAGTVGCAVAAVGILGASELAPDKLFVLLLIRANRFAIDDDDKGRVADKDAWRWVAGSG
ncbi:hypothetical protein C8R46DRAFT_331865 [Mycena filopes]|nr:hypothetical protein C8R46DRAFT_331865 [Mycena filopes]